VKISSQDSFLQLSHKECLSAGWLRRRVCNALSRLHELNTISLVSLSLPLNIISRKHQHLDNLLTQIHNVDYLILSFEKTTWLPRNQQPRRPPLRKMKEFFASTTRCSMRQRSWIQDQLKITRPSSTRSITKDGRTQSVPLCEISEAHHLSGPLFQSWKGRRLAPTLSKEKVVCLRSVSSSVCATQQQTCKPSPLFVKYLKDDYICANC
jgi:hypothetical protein